jgi:hypothetical protein
MTSRRMSTASQGWTHSNESLPTGSRTWQVPFVPRPYPDELLGSWLTRIALHNGGGAWRTMLEVSGYDRRTDSFSIDLVDSTPALTRLLTGLGTNYEDALLTLTTLPYWLAFDATSMENSWILGTTETPRIFAACGREKRLIGAIGLSRGTGRAKEVRYCPKCIDQDHCNAGEPYWHRAHQLPNYPICCFAPNIAACCLPRVRPAIGPDALSRVHC